jgi:formylmethanofuran dehydrogenase subunit B
VVIHPTDSEWEDLDGVVTDMEMVGMETDGTIQEVDGEVLLEMEKLQMLRIIIVNQPVSDLEILPRIIEVYYRKIWFSP